MIKVPRACGILLDNVAAIELAESWPGGVRTRVRAGLIGAIPTATNR